ESDQAGAPTVCVINEAFARRFFDGRTPIGMRVTPSSNDDRTAYQVVGVARNARTHGLRGNVEPQYFIASAQGRAAPISPTFLIRATTEAAPVLAAVRKTIQRADAALPIVSATTIEDQMAP